MGTRVRVLRCALMVSEGSEYASSSSSSEDVSDSWSACVYMVSGKAGEPVASRLSGGEDPRSPNWKPVASCVEKLGGFVLRRRPRLLLEKSGFRSPTDASDESASPPLPLVSSSAVPSPNGTRALRRRSRRSLRISISRSNWPMRSSTEPLFC